MADWYTTDYTFIGTDNDLDSLYDELKKIEETQDSGRGGSFETHWLGFVVESFGGHVKDIPCRGEWFNLKRENGVLTFSTDTANASCDGIMDLICEKYDSLKYYFRSDGPVPATNDKNAKFYKPYRITSSSLLDDTDISFLTKEEALKWLSEKTGLNILSEEEIENQTDFYLTYYEFISSENRTMANAFINMFWQSQFNND